jgi:nucleoside-diphosphate-sugar epimerase
MKILVTGSTGFVGKNLVTRLIREDHEILELTRSIKKSKELFGNKTIKLKITDLKFKLKIVEFNPEIVIHLASYLTSSDKFEDATKLIEVNISFLSKVLDAVSKTSLKLFINTGTFAEYFKGDGNLEPAYFYAATKTASRAFVDYYATTYNFKQCTVVPYTIYGGKDSQKKIIDIIYDSIDSKQPIDLSPGEQVLDFIHVEDVVEFYVTLVNKLDTLDYKTNFQLGTGKGTTLKELAILIENVIGKKTKINWGGKKYRSSDVMYAVADISNLKWKPRIDLPKGIKNNF